MQGRLQSNGRAPPGFCKYLKLAPYALCATLHAGEAMPATDLCRVVTTAVVSDLKRQLIVIHPEYDLHR
jgi:hypothetical protein